MEFSSIEEVIAFVEGAVSNSMPEMANEIKIIMDETTRSQVKGWSGDIFDSVIANSSSNIAEGSFENTGGWTSLVTGEKVGNPIKFLEAGTTWNRGASNIMDESFSKSQQEVPEKLKQYLIGMGIPIE